ncbi:hypothetical protein C8R47DRAFT_1105425 [Mycena vitilis]|nr:hypothetical protein C8R47DRAFT_1105425 [Mycena vitilis]
MNRPRASVLQLFDPLSARDAHSPDSDKENSFPDSDFFPQTHVQHASPVRLTRRLVEVGDVTVDNGGEEDDGEEGGEEEEQEEVEADENDTIGLPPPASSPRTPLADVTFDRERTPMRSKMYRRKAAAGELASSQPAPEDYAFASVIDAVDASGPIFGAQGNPSVVVCPPEETESSPASDTTSVATLSLATPTGSLISDTTMAFPTPSEASTSFLAPANQPTPASMTSFNLDCSSADLQSSFALHMKMNSDESFDLLNDRISFLEQSGDEESFDMGKELVSIVEQEETSATLGPEPSLVVPSADTTPPSPRGTPPRSESPLAECSQDSLPIVHQDLCAPSAISNQLSMPSLPPVFVAPPARQCSPIPVLSTSLPEPPALIPALKIVKRKRPDTAVPTVAVEIPVVQTDPPLDNRVAAPKASSAVPSKGRYVMEGPGPWRVPISGSDKDKEKASLVANHHKPVPAASGPRRVPLPTESPVTAAPAPAPAPAAALASTKAPSQVAQTSRALKRPLRVVAVNGSASGLPRAVSASRLPMPKSKVPPPSGLPRRRVV